MNHRPSPRRTVARKTGFLTTALAAGAIWLAVPMTLSSCTTSSDAATGTIALQTGIIVRAQYLLGQLACGNGDSQLQKYLVRVRRQGSQPTDKAVAASLYDCFADAYILNLSASDAGNLDFDLEIKAFSGASYAEQAAVIGNGRDADVWEQFDKLEATWSTTCKATQQANIQVLAVCDPLARSTEPGGVRLPVKSFAAGNGSTVACPTDFANALVTVNGPAAESAYVVIDADASVPDAGAPDGATPGGDAGSGDAGDGGDASFAALAPVAPATRSLAVPCSGTVRVDGANVGDVYTFDAQLLASGGAPAGQVHCQATVQPGVTVSATCDEVAR